MTDVKIQWQPHYQTIHVKEDGMDFLKQFFPDATANEMNLCLFSTSGIHGNYDTIDEVREWFIEDDKLSPITFLVVQPRICALRYGNCIPKSIEDFEFLEKLRQSSWDACLSIGV